MGISRISIIFSDASIEVATTWLTRQVAELEGAGKRIFVIRYPPRFAAELGIGLAHDAAEYQGNPASAHTVVPNEIAIEYEE